MSLTDRRRATAPGEWNFHTCSRCTAAFLDPRPTAAAGLMRGAPPLRHPHTPGWLTRQARRLTVALRNGYVNRRTDQRLRPAYRLGYWWHVWRPRSRARIHAELGWLPAGRPHRRLLDVGGQSPQAVGAARSSGWRVTVVLPDHRRPALLDMPDADVHVGSVADAGLSQGSFDLINVQGALERMHRPLEELEACARLLRPGGTIRISTPNLASLGHRHYRRHWSALDPPRNLVLFTAASLDRLLGSAR
ncbi:MAG: class I SAM-dependent methyltransferase, partial [Thermoleophilia bacterium]|nr:class I SAM-dependent methyltransferase [Thermoleophilia bacterium]